MQLNVMNQLSTETMPLAGLSQSGRPLSGLTALIVEDSRFAGEAVRLLCLRSGARLRRANCLRSAARHLQTYRPEIAIIDLGLPDGCGTELIGKLNRARPRIPVIIGLSGDPDLRDRALAAGANDFLAKPIENIVRFQQAILAHLPEKSRKWDLAVVTPNAIQPDNAVLREDIAHAIELLGKSRDPDSLDYIARFLAGLARSTYDEPLEQAALSLSNGIRSQQTDSDDVMRFGKLLHEKLVKISAG